MSIFRKEYNALSESQRELIDDMKSAAEDLYNILNNDCEVNREIALAKTKLEEAVMWASKGITQ